MALRPLRTSRRCASAAEAVIERVLATYLRPGVANLAPGTAHWSPSASLIADAVGNSGGNGYGDCRGEEKLREALRVKLERENRVDMTERDVMVTTGANQAYVHALLALCDPGDEVILFRPYYFSHLVALQLLGLRPTFVDCDAHSGLPDASRLRAALQHGGGRVRAVVLVSPSNPSGAVCGAALQARIRAECAMAGAWLLSDEAYEHFTFGEEPHASAAAATLPPAD